MQELKDHTEANLLFNEAYDRGKAAAQTEEYQAIVAPGDICPNQAIRIAEWEAMVDTGVVSTYGMQAGKFHVTDLEDARLIVLNAWTMGFKDGFTYETSLRSKLNLMKRGDTIRYIDGVYSINCTDDTYTVVRTINGIPATMFESAFQTDIASWVNIRGLGYGWK